MRSGKISVLRCIFGKIWPVTQKIRCGISGVFRFRIPEPELRIFQKLAKVPKVLKLKKWSKMTLKCLKWSNFNPKFWPFLTGIFKIWKNTGNVRQCILEILENTGNFGLLQNFWLNSGQGFQTLFSRKFLVSFAKLSVVRNPCLFLVHFWPSKFREGRYTGKAERPKIFG